MNGQRVKLTLRILGILLSALSLRQLGLADEATGVKYLITNDNESPNTATFYKIGGTQTAPTLARLVAVGTQGTGGTANVTAASKTINVAKVGTEACAYVSNVGSGNITGIVVPSQKYTGLFSASTKDTGLTGLVSNGTYLYAAYNSSKTIATFQMTANCSCPLWAM